MKKVGLPIKKADYKFTYKEYSTWPDDERWELIDGIAYNMSPGPNTMHQRISSILHNEIYNYLKGKPCNLFAAPFDVYFPEDPNQEFNSIDTIVQPDISVICDSSKIIKGVKEYWIIDPGNKYVEIFHLQTEGREAGKYDNGVLIPPADWREENTIARSEILEGFKINIKELFEKT